MLSPAFTACPTLAAIFRTFPGTEAATLRLRLLRLLPSELPSVPVLLSEQLQELQLLVQKRFLSLQQLLHMLFQLTVIV